MIRSGTTAFADMYFYMDEVAKAVVESGMRALLAYGIIAPEYNAKAREEIKKGLDLVERWHQEKGRIRVALGPHAPYTCAAKVWQEVTKEAKKYDIMIHTHLAETEDEVRLYENKGKQDSPVKYLESLGVFSVPLLAAHCVHLGDEDIEILSKRGVNVAHNPTSNLKLGSGIAPIEKLLDKEVNVAVGTDGAASNNSLDMMEEIKLAALLPKLRDPSAVPAPLALKMGTQNGALALGFEDVGVIREGMKADLIILNLDKVHLIPQHNLISNIVYSAWAGDVETVIIDGQVVMEEGKILTIDEEEVKNRVRGLSRKFS
jgi:5-methylthioadenosine/S-adenosylhomocysteine deaminase